MGRRFIVAGPVGGAESLSREMRTPRRFHFYGIAIGRWRALGLLIAKDGDAP